MNCHNGSDSPLDVYIGGNVQDIAREVVEGQETDDAFMVCDLSAIECQVDLWRQELPCVTPFYAVKCCTDPVIMHLVDSLGVNFDCSNKREISSVLNMGVTRDRIVYANTVKCSKSLKFALDHGVTLMTFDCAEELSKLKGTNARLLLRIVASEFGSRQAMNRKYGCYIDDAKELLQLACDMNLTVVGVAFHVGCAYEHPEIFSRTIADARKVFDIGEKVGIRMSVLDLGGGFPGGVRMREKFLKVTLAIRDGIDKYFPASSGVKIIAEPGQFFVTSAYTLVVKVLGKRKRTIENNGVFRQHQDVFINETKDNCLPKNLFQHLDVEFWPLNPSKQERRRDLLTTIWGGTCNPIDSIVENQLFFDVDIDEWLLMDNMGAYSLARVNGFNGIGFPAVKYIATAATAPMVHRILMGQVMGGGYGQIQDALDSRFLLNGRVAKPLLTYCARLLDSDSYQVHSCVAPMLSNCSLCDKYRMKS